MNALTVMVLIALLPDLAHAETNAEKVFGGWVRVTPETILQPVPDWHFHNTSLGSVTNEYRGFKPLQDGPASPGRPPVSPRSTTPEQVAGLQSNLRERR